MGATETTAKTILRKHKGVDSWFVSSAGMNLYRGCPHNCAYCDGRDERYRVEGVFERDLVVKVNAPELLARELEPRRRRKPSPGGFMLLGGGVGDSYMPIEEHYRVTRRALELLDRFGHAVHILTKSTLVVRDVPLLVKMAREGRALLSMSFSTLDDDVAALFEPGAPPPSARLEILGRLRAEGIPAGIFLMPLIPGVSDSEEAVAAVFERAGALGLEYVIPAGMTLKGGRQRDHFLGVLDRFDPSLRPLYERLYTENRWGAPQGEGARASENRVNRVAAASAIPKRIPAACFPPAMDPRWRARVMLSQMDDMSRLHGLGGRYRELEKVTAALPEGLFMTLDGALDALKKTERDLILALLDGATPPEYSRLLGEGPGLDKGIVG